MEQTQLSPGMLGAGGARIPVLKGGITLDRDSVIAHLDRSRLPIVTIKDRRERLRLVKDGEGAREPRELGGVALTHLRRVAEYIAGRAAERPVLSMVAQCSGITLGEIAARADGDVLSAQAQLDELISIGLIRAVQTDLGTGYELADKRV